MLAAIRDDTWNVLNMQHIIANSKRWDYSDIPGGGHNIVQCSCKWPGGQIRNSLFSFAIPFFLLLFYLLLFFHHTVTFFLLPFFPLLFFWGKIVTFFPVSLSPSRLLPIFLLLFFLLLFSYPKLLLFFCYLFSCYFLSEHRPFYPGYFRDPMGIQVGSH